MEKKRDRGKIRVVIGIAWLACGGIENQFYEVLKRMDRSKFEPIIVTLREGGDLWDKYSSLGFPMRVVKRYGRYDPAITLRATQIVREFDPDLVCTLTLSANFYIRLAGILAGVPGIISSKLAVLRGSRWTVFLPDRLLAKYTDLVIVNSPVVEEVFVKSSGTPRERVVMIPNGLDLDRFRPGIESGKVRAEFGIPEGNKIVGIISRLHPVKGHRHFLDAASIFLRDNPDTSVLIVGDGPCEPELRKQASDLGISDRVHFAGYRSDVDVLYNAMDVAAFTSLSEGLSNSLIEGMATETPMVASDLDENRFCAEDEKTALLFPPCDAEAMAERITRLLRDSELRKRIGSAARESVKSRFSFENMVTEHEKAFIDVYNKKVPGRK